MKKFFLFFLLVLLWACPSANTPTTPTTPNPPQVLVLRYAKLGGAANVAVAGTINVLCRPAPPAVPQMDAATCSVAAQYVRDTAATLDKIIDEAKSADPWVIMRSKIAGIGAAAVVNLTVPDVMLKAQIAALQSLVQQILEVK